MLRKVTAFRGKYCCEVFDFSYKEKIFFLKKKRENKSWYKIVTNIHYD
jgi:hypothetical protein